MHIKSTYPEVPPLQDTNAHLALLRRPGQVDWPDFTFLIDARTGKTRTFREFEERVKYAATALGTPVIQGGLGLSAENGDVIGIMSDNCMVSKYHRFLHDRTSALLDQDYIAFVHACLYIATPFALISALSKPFELKHALKLSKATCLFVDEKLLSAVLPIAKGLGISSMKIFPMSGHVSGRRSFSQLIDETRRRRADIIPVRSVRKDTLAYLIFSSGTTGLPKGTYQE
jgi:acyl-CoA synthetase (AMP-forming)/AMP-acid ligase II